MAGFSSAVAARVLSAVWRRLGLAEQARLLRFGSNAIYLVEDGPVVRIGRDEGVLPIAERELAAARWLAEQGYPSGRVWEDVEGQPLVVDGHPVTFWVPVEETERRPLFSDLGALLRRLHDLPAPVVPVELPEFGPFGKMRERIAHAYDVDEADRRFLAERVERIEAAFGEWESQLPVGHIHGDAHRGNVLCSPNGAVLLDFEEFGTGPREWDLVPTALSTFRFGVTDEQYGEFVDAYGFDVLKSPGVDLLLDLRELTMTTWLMQNVGEGPEVAEEFRDRLASMRTGDRRREWRAF